MTIAKIKYDGETYNLEYDGQKIKKHELLKRLALACIGELLNSKIGRKKIGEFDLVMNTAIRDKRNEIFLIEQEERRIKWEKKHGNN